MNTSLVFTFIGADRPGLVESVAARVARHGGNWQESRMVELAGQFAGIARVTVLEDQETALRDDLEALRSEGLEISISRAGADDKHKRPRCTLSVVGNDRPGIVKEITGALKHRNINLIEMSSNLSSVPMSGEALFEARIDADLPEGSDLAELQSALDDIADQLSIDIVIE